MPDNPCYIILDLDFGCLSALERDQFFARLEILLEEAVQLRENQHSPQNYILVPTPHSKSLPEWASAYINDSEEDPDSSPIFDIIEFYPTHEVQYGQDFRNYPSLDPDFLERLQKVTCYVTNKPEMGFIDNHVTLEYFLSGEVSLATTYPEQVQPFEKSLVKVSQFVNESESSGSSESSDQTAQEDNSPDDEPEGGTQIKGHPRPTPSDDQPDLDGEADHEPSLPDLPVESEAGHSANADAEIYFISIDSTKNSLENGENNHAIWLGYIVFCDFLISSAFLSSINNNSLSNSLNYSYDESIAAYNLNSVQVNLQNERQTNYNTKISGENVSNYNYWSLSETNWALDIFSLKLNSENLDRNSNSGLTINATLSHSFNNTESHSNQHNFNPLANFKFPEKSNILKSYIFGKYQSIGSTKAQSPKSSETLEPIRVNHSQLSLPSPKSVLNSDSGVSTDRERTKEKPITFLYIINNSIQVSNIEGTNFVENSEEKGVGIVFHELSNSSKNSVLTAFQNIKKEPRLPLDMAELEELLPHGDSATQESDDHLSSKDIEASTLNNVILSEENVDAASPSIPLPSVYFNDDSVLDDSPINSIDTTSPPESPNLVDDSPVESIEQITPPVVSSDFSVESGDPVLVNDETTATDSEDQTLDFNPIRNFLGNIDQVFSSSYIVSNSLFIQSSSSSWRCNYFASTMSHSSEFNIAFLRVFNYGLTIDRLSGFSELSLHNSSLLISDNGIAYSGVGINLFSGNLGIYSTLVTTENSLISYGHFHAKLTLEWQEKARALHQSLVYKSSVFGSTLVANDDLIYGGIMASDAENALTTTETPILDGWNIFGDVALDVALLSHYVSPLGQSTRLGLEAETQHSSVFDNTRSIPGSPMDISPLSLLDRVSTDGFL